MANFDIILMLNRRILRVKVFKTVFARAENPSMTLAEGQAQFDALCQGTRDLYLLMLALAPALTREAASRIAAAKAKFHPSEEEKNPNLKFVENGLAKILDEDPDFNKIISKKKLSWEQYDVFLWHLYESIRQKDYFKSYMESSSRSLQEDAALWVRIYEEELVDNDELESILEELSIWWNNDLAYSLTTCCQTMEALAGGRQWSMPELVADKDFAYALLRRAFTDFDKDVQKISDATPKWDIARVCTTDLALIICGVAEADAFPSMAKKIIVNEYVEISKYFSTPESKGFVNGVLDNLITSNN